MRFSFSLSSGTGSSERRRRFWQTLENMTDKTKSYPVIQAIVTVVITAAAVFPPQLAATPHSSGEKGVKCSEKRGLLI